MAIRDRLTVTLKSGQVFSLQVTRQGGSLRTNIPRDFGRASEILEVFEEDSSTPPRQLRTLRVTATEIASILQDVAPAASEAPSKPRKPRQPKVTDE